MKEVAAAGKDAFLAQLADERGSKVREYVAVTGTGTDSPSLRPTWRPSHSARDGRH